MFFSLTISLLFIFLLSTFIIIKKDVNKLTIGDTILIRNYYFLIILLSAAIFIFFPTSTWAFALGIVVAFGSTWLVILAFGCTPEHSVALGKPSRTYLKTYLKNNEF